MYEQPNHTRKEPIFATGAGSDSDEGYSRSRSVRRQRNKSRQYSPGPISLDESLDPAPPISYWSTKRHFTCGNPTPPPPWSTKPITWRHTSSLPGKLKTANAALVVCLNIDVDPPDVVRTSPCAVLECWVDPRSMPSHKALEAIGANLKHQFEGLSLKIQYKPILDPSFEDLRKACQQLRKQAKDDAVLFHYNGHGVPKPTASGELWCFNRNYTQYIPVSLQEVQNWLGSPGVYIWDCSAAGHLLNNFNAFAQRRDEDIRKIHGQFPEGVLPFSQSLQLAACAADETLPTCPDLPADVFTSCLTSPIDIAIRHYIMTNKTNLNIDAGFHMPGDLKDRRTPLGELNWIFTAITDTIAWTTFSPEIFARLYRSDLLIASLFRNFLLAERIMKGYNCTPHTSPPLPSTNTHPLWATWDLALDACVRQLPDLLAAEQAPTDRPKPPPYQYVPSRFFADQLTAFEVWISRGGSALTKRGPMSLPPGSHTPTSENGHVNGNGVVDSWDNVKEHHLVPRKPPDQLPIVLQVLLSQPHRLRALILLSQFVDLGPWAVNLVLTIGIFPYISKLLQAPGPDLRPVLIFIWARILAVDPSVQSDLYNNAQGYRYFSNILAMKPDNAHVLPNSSEHQAMCSFILAALARDFQKGQQACWEENVFQSCYERLEEPDFLLRQWTALCIAQMWCGFDEGKMIGVNRGTQDKLTHLLSDDSAEVRCAALYALGTFMGASGSREPEKRGGGGSGAMYDLDERDHFRMEVAVVTGATLVVKDDASPMCRKELLILISCLVKEWRGYFVVCAWLYWEEEERRRRHGHGYSVSSEAVSEWLSNFEDDGRLREESRVLLSSFYTIFVVLLDLSTDPYLEVATHAQTIVDYILALLLDSPFKNLESSPFTSPPTAPKSYQPQQQQLVPRDRKASLQSLAPASTLAASQSDKGAGLRPSLSRSDTMTSTISNTIKRTSSFANALKNLAGTISFPSMDDSHSRNASPAPSFQTPTPKITQSEVSRPPSPILNVAHYTSPYDNSYPHSQPSPTRTESESDESRSPPKFQPSDVMEALMEEDMERLRARRRPKRTSSSQHTGYHNYHYSGNMNMPSPSNSTFSVDSTNSVILGLGTGLGPGIRDVLPLKSTFFDWCCEYFTEPQMRQTEADEPGSVQYNYQVWRQQRNEQVDVETRSQADVASFRPWDRPVATLHGSPNPLVMTFHSYDKHLFVANDSDVVSVWDWGQRKKLRSFANGNPKGTSITSMVIINQDVGGIVVTGSADGIVRLYRHYDPALDPGPAQMVSAFRGLNDLVQMRSSQGAGLVMDWKQSTGILLVGGDSKVIKTWDAQTEIQGLDLDTDSNSPVTSIVTDHGASQTFVAGFGDGVVKVFDRRLEEEESIIRTYSEHTSWIQNVRPHPTAGSQFLSASLDGEVKLWDLRGKDEAVQTWKFMPSGLSAFDVHNNTEVFAGWPLPKDLRHHEYKLAISTRYGPIAVYRNIRYPVTVQHINWIDDAACAVAPVILYSAGDLSDDKKANTTRKNAKAVAKNQKGPSSGIWPCKINGCNKQFAREADLKRHQRTTKLHSMPGFSCPQCDATFTRTDALRRHQKSRHNGVADVLETGRESDEPAQSSSRSSSAAPSSKGKERETSTVPMTEPIGGKSTSSLATPVMSYYRQHTANNSSYPPRPATYAQVSLPTSSTRTDPNGWNSWDGQAPPPLGGLHLMYIAPYYRSNAVAAPPPLLTPVGQTGFSSTSQSSNRKSSVDSKASADSPKSVSSSSTNAAEIEGSDSPPLLPAVPVIGPSLSRTAPRRSPSPENRDFRQFLTDAGMEAVTSNDDDIRDHSSMDMDHITSDDKSSVDSWRQEHHSISPAEDDSVARFINVRDNDRPQVMSHSRVREYGHIIRPIAMAPILTENGGPILNPAELLVQESLASPEPS
uniref:C2H2-type domain-containing protein n=1 Tax=Moniliophthora roreri TaxID=221103 RepID=A0A0W0FX59_MONRR